MKSFYLLLIVLVSGCNQIPKQKDNLFILNPLLSLDTAGKIISPSPNPGQAYLLPFTIIVDSSGQLYYYQRRYFNNSFDLVWDRIPLCTNLQPIDIILLPEKGIDDFIKQNIEMVNPHVRRVAIAFLKDTVRSDALVKVFKVLRDTSIHAIWVFRAASQEERIVLNHKKRDVYYDENLIKWDSTITNFFPDTNILKFVPHKKD